MHPLSIISIVIFILAISILIYCYLEKKALPNLLLISILLLLSGFILYYFHDSKDNGGSFHEMPGEEYNRGINNYSVQHMNEIDSYSWGSLDTLEKLIKNYKDMHPNAKNFSIILRPITYDKKHALSYITNVFKTYPGTKKEYIEYYNRLGYNFNEETSENDLSLPLVNRTSSAITLENELSYKKYHIDMGRLCPPNCPKLQ